MPSQAYPRLVLGNSTETLGILPGRVGKICQVGRAGGMPGRAGRRCCMAMPGYVLHIQAWHIRPQPWHAFHIYKRQLYKRLFTGTLPLKFAIGR